MSETDSRAIQAEDRFAFAAYAAFGTIPMEAAKLHWKFSPPQDKQRWRLAASAVLEEAGRQERQEMDHQQYLSTVSA